MKLVAYEWHLREVMAAAGMYSTTKLVPLLHERGIDLSTSQVYRLAAEKPERLNMHVLAALMDIFDCTATDLVTRVSIGAAASSPVRTGTDDRNELRTYDSLRRKGNRPKRADILQSDV
jgi:DNA-binding Xre family transcriptional regulator